MAVLETILFMVCTLIVLQKMKGLQSGAATST